MTSPPQQELTKIENNKRKTKSGEPKEKNKGQREDKIFSTVILSLLFFQLVLPHDRNEDRRQHLRFLHALFLPHPQIRSSTICWLIEWRQKMSLFGLGSKYEFMFMFLFALSICIFHGFTYHFVFCNLCVYLHDVVYKVAKRNNTSWLVKIQTYHTTWPTIGTYVLSTEYCSVKRMIIARNGPKYAPSMDMCLSS